MSASPAQPFLRVPPFPGARVGSFGRAAHAPQHLNDDQVDALIAELKRHRVGGDYWGQQPDFPDQPYVLIKSAEAAECGTIAPGAPIVRWGEERCDPWHMVSAASHVHVNADDELALVAAMAGVPLTCIGEGRFSSLDNRQASLRHVFRETIGACAYANPFNDQPLTVSEAIQLCGFWRHLIDSNREISAAIGFGLWKHRTVAPLLWAGSDVPFLSSAPAGPQRAVAVWKSRTSAGALDELSASGRRLLEVEDGFIRSVGLGADCVPPLSIVVDPLGIYFDPRTPSLLEQLIQSGPFTTDLLQRARQLRELVVASGVSKYGAASSSGLRRRAERTHILVPGQVEDDRSVQCGGGEVRSNLELLRRVRSQSPEAYIIYKPHPDVEAGHRVGAVPDDQCLSFADEIVRDQPIGALIELAEEVHVNTSLAGFEALLRSKPVKTHGVPFYAGWGLTEDFGEIPARRTARRSLDELVAAALLLYPRYLDPVTGLPCPPEVLVRRIAEGARSTPGAVVQLRRLQGRWKKLTTRARRAR